MRDGIAPQRSAPFDSGIDTTIRLDRSGYRPCQRTSRSPERDDPSETPAAIRRTQSAGLHSEVVINSLKYGELIYLLYFYIMNKSLAIIQYMVDSGDIDITQLYTIFKSFGTALPIIPCLLQRGQRIVRVRINKDFDSHYTHLTQLSYPPAACASLQRASLPGNPLFYGSVFTHSDNSNHALPRIVTLYETCEEIRDKTCATRQKMTFSI